MVRLRWVQIVNADAATLWDACATPAGLSRWQADQVRGSVEPGATVRMDWPGLGVGADLDVVVTAPPHRLIMRNGDASVEYEIEDGSVILSHIGLGEDDDLEAFGSSWRCALAVLRHSVEKQPGRERTVTWALARVRTTASIAHTMFTDATALGAWLGRSDGIGPVGSAWRAETRDRTMQGRVLANIPERDVVLSFDEDRSVAVFRTLPGRGASEERTVAIQHSQWSDRGDEAHAFAAALDRLIRLLRQGGSS
jgi:uncharacterized protein YndB with AHSA1/START domain